MAMADEWTVVQNRTSTKNHHRRHYGKFLSHGSVPRRSTGISSGLYSAAVAAARGSTTDDHIGGSSSTSCGRQWPTEEQQREEKDRIKMEIFECMLALENYLQSRKNDLSDPFIALMNVATAASTHAEDQRGHSMQQDNQTDDPNHGEKITNCLYLRDIVAYGIGNFATERFRAPMLQLAFLLLIRRWSATISTQTDHMNHPPITCIGDNDKSYSDASGESFQNEQRQVPIYYHDPCILPVERELMVSTFHIHVLESNEMGKLSMESIRLQYQQTVGNVSLSLSPQPSPSTCQRECIEPFTTLFFMPHCPMQLYCNVLWAHWHHIFPHPKEYQETYDTDNEIDVSSSHNFDQSIQSNYGGPSSILIFGNSFQTYDDRTISSESRLNPTNSVLRIASFTKEIPITISTNVDRNYGGGEIIVDALRHLDTAFNDCNIIYFDRDIIELNNAHPERPEEWIASQDSGSESGELR
jgi:hypothetical protein